MRITPQSFRRVREDNKQYNRTFSFRTCHCAECGTKRNLNDKYVHDKAIPNCEVPSKNMFRTAPQNFKRVAIPRPKKDLPFSRPLIADGFGVAILPRVARSRDLLIFVGAFVLNRLPGVIHGFSLSGN